ncbi:MAG: hypothetical protein K2K31_03115, partial [Clostridia bacterium]|nr:hypothetical protein [Clostridia bacterium]
MFNSMLMETVGVDTLIWNVLIILAVIVAGALIVYLIWEAVTSFIAKSKNGKVEELNLDSNKKSDNSEDFDLDQPQELVVEENAETVEEVDEVKAEEEQEELESETEREERENAERRAYLEARRQELIKRMQEEMEEEEEETEEDVEEESETVETPEEESVVEEEE